MGLELMGATDMRREGLLMKSPWKALTDAVRGPVWSRVLTVVLVLVGGLDAALTYQAFAMFLDADLFATGARSQAELQSGVANGLLALAITAVLTLLCIVLPQVAAKMLRPDEGRVGRRISGRLKVPLAVVLLVGAVLLAVCIGVVRYSGQLATNGATSISEDASQLATQAVANASGGISEDRKAMTFSVITVFGLMAVELLSFVAASMRGDGSVDPIAEVLKMQREMHRHEQAAEAKRREAGRLEEAALGRVDAWETSFLARVDQRYDEICVKYRGV